MHKSDYDEKPVEMRAFFITDELKSRLFHREIKRGDKIIPSDLHLNFILAILHS